MQKSRLALAKQFQKNFFNGGMPCALPFFILSDVEPAKK
jgi:hypothetical protein